MVMHGKLTAKKITKKTKRKTKEKKKKKKKNRGQAKQEAKGCSFGRPCATGGRETHDVFTMPCV